MYYNYKPSKDNIKLSLNSCVYIEAPQWPSGLRAHLMHSRSEIDPCQRAIDIISYANVFLNINVFSGSSIIIIIIIIIIKYYLLLQNQN